MTYKHLKSKQISLLSISGDDATRFLQGQLTNDINALDNTWQFSGYCSPKGRLLALFTLWKHGNIIYALLPSDIVEATVKRLRMYVMRSKVSIEVEDNIKLIENDSDSSERFSYHNSNAEHCLSFGGRSLLIGMDSSDSENTISGDWLQRNIQDGLPQISNDSTELFVPQMVNLDILGGVNFKKGCYTGQEIVARMHYLGKLKQRMFVCELDSNDQVEVGDKVILGDKSAGNIVSCENNMALAVLRTEFALSESGEPGFYVETDDKKIGLSVNATQPYSHELSPS